jgi:hypothetical protein
MNLLAFLDGKADARRLAKEASRKLMTAFENRFIDEEHDTIIFDGSNEWFMAVTREDRLLLHGI